MRRRGDEIRRNAIAEEQQQQEQQRRQKSSRRSGAPSASHHGILPEVASSDDDPNDATTAGNALQMFRFETAGGGTRAVSFAPPPVPENSLAVSATTSRDRSPSGAPSVDRVPRPSATDGGLMAVPTLFLANDGGCTDEQIHHFLMSIGSGDAINMRFVDERQTDGPLAQPVMWSGIVKRIVGRDDGSQLRALVTFPTIGCPGLEQLAQNVLRCEVPKTGLFNLQIPLCNVKVLFLERAGVVDLLSTIPNARDDNEVVTTFEHGVAVKQAPPGGAAIASPIAPLPLLPPLPPTQPQLAPTDDPAQRRLESMMTAVAQQQQQAQQHYT
jgi:hypothetical protein